MARKNKRNKVLYIITFILLIAILSFSITSYFYFDNKIKEEKAKQNKQQEEIKSKEKIYKEKQDNLNTEIKNIESYNNLDEQITSLKSDYFKSIKELEDAILSGKSNKKIAYLTFDDGPYYNTYKVLDILDKYNVKATFFTTNINGEYCYDNKDKKCQVMYKEYLKRGHTIANHTYTHGIRTGLYNSVDSFMNAVIKQEELISKKTDGYITNIVRFPGGSPTAGNLKSGIIKKLRERKYGWVDWTAQDGDGGGLKTVEEARANFKSSVNDKIEVILFHDYNSITTSLLPEFIESLQNQGYILLPLFYESNMINK